MEGLVAEDMERAHPTHAYLDARFCAIGGARHGGRCRAVGDEAFPTHTEEQPLRVAVRLRWACSSCEVAAASGNQSDAISNRPYDTSVAHCFCARARGRALQGAWVESLRSVSGGLQCRWSWGR